MPHRSDRKEGFNLLGVGAVACVVCCAGPIVGVLGGISLGGFASTAVIGWAGLVIAIVAGTAWFIARQRATSPAEPAEHAPVAPPIRKP